MYGTSPSKINEPLPFQGEGNKLCTFTGAPHNSAFVTPRKLSVCNDETLPVGTSLPLRQATVWPAELVVCGVTVSAETHASGPVLMEIIRSQLLPRGRPLGMQ